MVIFSRGRKGGGRHARDQRPGRPGTEPEPTYDEDRAADEPRRGPYDISEAPAGVQRLDLGSLLIPAVADVEVRVQANPDGAIQQVVLVHGDDALQLGVFAAPRSQGIWDEVREEIRATLFSDGVAAEEAEGDYGTELRARVRTPEGLTDLRFVGIDGPRWMVRGVYQGGVATDPSAAGPLNEVLEGLVVDRGQEAKPVREALPLHLPREIAAQAGQEGQQGQVSLGTGAGTGPPSSNGSGPGQEGPDNHPTMPRPR